MCIEITDTALSEIEIPALYLEALDQIVANSLRFESVDEYVRFLLRAVVDNRQAKQSQSD